MTRGMYTAATGMLANQTALDSIAQNLANANTTGYKQDVPQFQSFADTLLHRISRDAPQASVGGLGKGVAIESLATDFSAGSLQRTDNPLDVALTGTAALVVKTAQGVRITRDGALTRSPKGQLVQVNGGNPVLDAKGQPITIPTKAQDVTISPGGLVTADGRRVAQLRLANIGRASGAAKIGDNQFTEANLGTPTAGSSVQQGFLEESNVSVVKEMVAMISVNRAYDTNSKMLQAEDSATGKAVNDVAKL